MFIDKKKYIKPIINGHCFSFDIYDFDYNNVYEDHIIDLSKCDIGDSCYFYEHTVIPPFNYYIVNNFNRPKLII